MTQNKDKYKVADRRYSSENDANGNKWTAKMAMFLITCTAKKIF